MGGGGVAPVRARRCRTADERLAGFVGWRRPTTRALGLAVGGLGEGCARWLSVWCLFFSFSRHSREPRLAVWSGSGDVLLRPASSLGLPESSSSSRYVSRRREWRLGQRWPDLVTGGVYGDGTRSVTVRPASGECGGERFWSRRRRRRWALVLVVIPNVFPAQILCMQTKCRRGPAGYGGGMPPWMLPCLQ
jgi:hypothetical protein